MFTTLSRKFLHPLIAASLALALVVSPMSTSSAQAHGRHNNGDFVAAMVALGLFGLIVTNEAGKRNGVTITVPSNKRLPEACLKTYDTPNGDRTAFSKSCLRNNFSGYSRLPSSCKSSMRVFDNYGYLRTKEVYRPRCLQDHGYRIYYR